MFCLSDPEKGCGFGCLIFRQLGRDRVGVVQKPVRRRIDPAVKARAVLRCYGQNALAHHLFLKLRIRGVVPNGKGIRVAVQRLSVIPAESRKALKRIKVLKELIKAGLKRELILKITSISEHEYSILQRELLATA